ncbi:glutamate--cysteine ligase [Rhodospirillum rubrum]|uniref:glutamate--cysteine ligase n=1 Tax=Rhodospirillum rubrum TaxID=1085 RepID=UPI001908E950|nr:glutamate--cysteine ligase [Rhodospirillum rubrum]MBK1664256.1 glutamate--cysteine ligase [Rhodospirillum rubrum]MBK1675326.1 glutamate--cysteine ligase [Rhodospirillum rubrum]
MSSLTDASILSAPLTRDDLVAHMAGGSRPKADWRIGTEHEKYAFTIADGRPLTYEGPHGVRALLEGLTRFGWSPVYEGETVIALTCPTMGSVTLEPGGQIELSGAQLETVHGTCCEVTTHHRNLKIVGGELGIGFLGIGFNPKWRREDISLMPKGRYKLMSEYMPKVGSLGLDMMLRTCTVQTNLDFGGEADMVRKFRVSLALQPIATALWANSPFTEGKPNGFLSYRSHIWTDTDPARTGILPFVFEDGMGFERYVDYLLDVPMYFVYREGRYIDATGQSFRDFMAGRLAALPGERPTIADWDDHMTVAFPEVRLKRYLEMRGADGGPWLRLCALPAFWVGLLYETTSLDAAWDLVKDWTAEEHAQLRAQVPRLALKTPFRKGTLQDVALRALEISQAGLAARGRLNSKGRDETGFLDPLWTIARSGRTQAEDLLESFLTRWNGEIDPVFTECAY